MDEETIMRRLGALKKATHAKNALSSIAGVCLAASGVFWGVLHWQLLVIDGAGVPQIIIAATMSLVYTLVLPLLLSMLVPTTPAGMALQQTQWRTVGFPVIIASAGFLIWHAKSMLLLWWLAQPQVADSGLALLYTVSCIIGFVVIPALSWVQMTPEQWLDQIRQAHAVKRLKIAQSGELAILKTRILWAKQKAAMSYAALLPAEQQEIQATLRGLFMSIADSQREIVSTLGISADVERMLGIPGDAEIAQSLDYVQQQLARPAQAIDRALTYEDDSYRESHVRPSREPERTHVDSRLQPSEPRGTRAVIRRHMTSPDDAYARAANDAFGRKPWTIKQLAAELDIGETKAREMRDDWRARGLIDEAHLGRWYFVEVGHD